VTVRPTDEGRVTRLFAAPFAAGRENMRQLVYLRWLAVAGQCVTILVVHSGMGVSLPLAPMFLVIGGLVVLNLVSSLGLRRARQVSNTELFVELLLDVTALSALLYLSGGASNPFIALFLLQVVLGAVLLEAWSTWVIVGVTSVAFMVLSVTHRPLALPAGASEGFFDLYVRGALVCFCLIAVLLVLFVTRITSNLRRQDARLAELRQHAAEEDHIVRMGLLASGAAHELGTPLASLSVILNDWGHMPLLTSDPQLAEEINEMTAAVGRCKTILTGILQSAGEARGEQPTITTVGGFLADLVENWRARRPDIHLDFENRFGEDPAIVSDTALRQVICNVLDNAAEASPRGAALLADREGDALVLRLRDHGPGFTEAMLANIGKPYHSTKSRAGGGLGLFLVVNVMRKLGGEVRVANLEGGGAMVELILPLSALAFTGDVSLGD